MVFELRHRNPVLVGGLNAPYVSACFEEWRPVVAVDDFRFVFVFEGRLGVSKVCFFSLIWGCLIMYLVVCNGRRWDFVEPLS